MAMPTDRGLVRRPAPWLALEPLEARVALSALTWDGGGGNALWSNPLNWSGNFVPRQVDDVAISVAGVFQSRDGGATWQPRNEGTVGMAEAMMEMTGEPAKHPEVHRCVHKVVRHPERHNVLYQQNHDGVYRTDDGCTSWVDIADGVSSRFGFVIGITRDASVYVIPQDMDKVRFSGQLGVYRLREGATSWDRLTNGLPELDNVTLYREGMATDNCPTGGVYFGTSEGDLFHTTDGGETWSKLATGMPAMRSVSCEHFAWRVTAQ